MSSHKQSMVEAVSMECNRTYRKWCLRHPQFAQTGRVVRRSSSLPSLAPVRSLTFLLLFSQHIIAHSLGSALVADILSDQTTTFPKLPSLPKQVRLLFTPPFPRSNLYLPCFPSSPGSFPFRRLSFPQFD